MKLSVLRLNIPQAILMHTSLLAAVLVAPMLLCADEARADEARADEPSWSQRKCQFYQSFRDQLQTSRDKSELGEEFLKSEDAFVASGCTGRIHVCPTTEAELDYANKMSLRMMNEGATGSFLPYSCAPTD